MTYKPKSEFLREMQSRGFMADCTDLEGLDDALTKGVVTAYIGFDATANSLHIGNMLQLMMLRWFQKTGHRPITLMGGGTTKIGDPSGKDASRQMLTAEKINDNINSIRGALEKYLRYDDSENGAILANNADWLDHLNYIDFLRDYGPHFTINRMLSFDSVKLRLDREQPLTFLEFNYMLLQAYDYMELNNRYDCTLQLGGSDQWGNIVNGVDLTRRINKKSVFGFTAPLITKSDGSKMGKSVQGAVWLNADQMSPYEFWQFWRNTDDADVGKFMKLFTEIPVEECDRLGALQGSDINDAKIVLADAVTTLAHGADAAAAAKATAREVFEKGGVGAELPTITLPAADIGDGISIVQLFVKSGLSKSGKDAKRLIAEGGAKLNDVAVTEAGTMVTADMIRNSVKLSAGKKRHALVNLA